ncbi:lipopolysaccharide-induced transcription factor regulating tumor necrosis factor alpha, putative [Entamoeba invadens IP1]|uniref:lipopolysaccharide-induced transcription factor regulating tumor necrosis factor alpha, putative n=1 Tax=Entamoeba invadens IP1 TaxID=370355 RepID=UPI0002C3F930|nr:lipopolysaccharide-induced transcription factor regulating tumor necrosis factor alpha, putative [Entamoeba invadens IP1]ELP93258.1 lipopolysaccharide-induced transcription factor regulating tumor necrosis factor alpha, putative [Entamoeba invadens IP1]|eukprot:XP_004260029.1 lipopolysaccharide-induced transcription factor regulating tumor necrosis factor alpha, putative [Entamoeba invadens IP1]
MEGQETQPPMQEPQMNQPPMGVDPNMQQMGQPPMQQNPPMVMDPNMQQMQQPPMQPMQPMGMDPNMQQSMTQQSQPIVYQQPQGTPVQPQVVQASQQPTVFTKVSQQAFCPTCNKLVTTKVAHNMSALGCLLCCLFTWMGCCCIGLIFCCIPTFADTVHTCPTCHNKLGTCAAK